MRMAVLAALVLLVVAGCGAAPAGRAQELNGTWNSDRATYTFNMNNMTFRQVAAGLDTTARIEIVSQAGNEVVLRNDTGNLLTAIFQDDGTVSLAQLNQVPVILKRAP